MTDADESATFHGRLFDGGRPGTPHRVLDNSTVKRWEAADRPAPGDRPGRARRVSGRRATVESLARS